MSLAQAIRAAREQHRAGAGSVLDVLLRMPDLDLVAMPASSGVAVLGPNEQATPDFTLLDAETARKWRCVFVRCGARLLLATEDPWDEVLLQRVARSVGTQPAPLAATQAQLDKWLGAAATSQSPLAATTATMADGPIVDFVNQAIQTGYALGASDIHFECHRSGVTAKHRLDGVMAHHADLHGMQGAQEVISRVKVLAQLDITERRLPQDGRFRFELGGYAVDIRVSIMPSVHGEDAVLRLLDRARLRGGAQAASLGLLGFDEKSANSIRALAGQPSGLLLVTGPTGSGKTTTVYAALAEINTGLEKIITIEDPVEYELSGVLQIPVNERKGLTFARGLRSILRHDPDRILVGEIRDAETAEIAVQSALTGHLVFTTVHANSMADVVGRFRHFGLDMFGFMSSLNGVVVQRLVRQLCSACASERAASADDRAWLTRHGSLDVDVVPAARGCPACHGSGYKGRFVIAEIHFVDDALRDHVTGGAALSVLKLHATENAVVSLTAQAAAHVLEGRTTTEEVRRVIGLS